jgi:hypothetical protein
MKLANGGGVYQVLNDNVVPCTPGQVFLFEAQVIASATVATNSFGMRVVYYDAAGGLSVASDTSYTPTTSWTKYSGTTTIPSGAVAVGCALISWGITGGDVYVDDCYFRRCSDASLIVDGAITSAKIATGAITANMITTGTLDASAVTVTNLNASNITTGTLTADVVAFSDGTSLNSARILNVISNQATTASIQPGAVNSALSYSATSVSLPSGTETSMELVAPSGYINPVVVSARATIQISAGYGTTSGTVTVRLYKTGAGGYVGSSGSYVMYSVQGNIGTYPQSLPIFIEAIDTSPAIGYGYYVTVTQVGASSYTFGDVQLICDQRSV